MPEVPARRCVCPGSFDPVTVGHVDVILRAARLFDEVVVSVAANPAKDPLFTLDERVAMVRESVAGTPEAQRVVVHALPTGLLVDHCRELDAPVVVKGLRGGTDFAYELPMALMNRHLQEVETVFLAGDPRYEHISSSLVKEVAGHGGDVAGLVPATVLPALLERLEQRRAAQGRHGGTDGQRQAAAEAVQPEEGR
ncbi:phosphopantetheine adenylyltransferase [Kineococcus xinjiangensis]|uniref:Phosphopantetheine adenylyltransferase n=1 Tax=Kineococcus xinjiangensis TaxID=512762 RepID=A0A2S6IW08_9ACTN|nr:pantetheine-phosphate adenylyltransferase [Kineococcus xinjiangensis]PPK98547.1 phosphopantetheine adenylyltransferase [Kineococcus xinjiangensis]